MDVLIREIADTLHRLHDAPTLEDERIEAGVRSIVPESENCARLVARAMRSITRCKCVSLFFNERQGDARVSARVSPCCSLKNISNEDSESPSFALLETVRDCRAPGGRCLATYDGRWNALEVDLAALVDDMLKDWSIADDEDVGTFFTCVDDVERASLAYLFKFSDGISIARFAMCAARYFDVQELIRFGGCYCSVGDKKGPKRITAVVNLNSLPELERIGFKIVLSDGVPLSADHHRRAHQ